MKDCIYLDNAATTFPKPPEVYSAIEHALRDIGASPGRGGHRRSLEASRILLETREAIAGLIGADDSSRIVFTASATEAINLALFGLLERGDCVVTTSMEHNAVCRPLFALEKEHGIQIEKVPGDRKGWIDPDDFIAHCRRFTPKVAVVSHVSNVSGTVQEIEVIARYCRDAGILLLVDAAQSIGCLEVDVRSGIDLLAAPGHKGLLGPQGTGFLYIREGLLPRPLFYGGTGGSSSSFDLPLEVPDRYESGTLNVPGIAGLGAGVRWVLEKGIPQIAAHEKRLRGMLWQGLNAIDGVTLFGPGASDQAGPVLSFVHRVIDPSSLGFRLDHEFGIMVRTGLHCAPDAHRTISSFPTGTIRVSPGCFTTEDEIALFLNAVGIVGKPDC